MKRKVLVLRDLTHDQARAVVEERLRRRGKADTEELMELGIELGLLVGILDELRAEGKIKPADEPDHNR